MATEMLMMITRPWPMRPRPAAVLQADAFGSAAHEAADQLRQQYADQQDQGGAEYLGQVQGEQVEGGGDPLQAQGLGGGDQKHQQHEPVDDLADQRRHLDLEAGAARAVLVSPVPASRRSRPSLPSSLDSRVSSSLATTKPSTTTSTEPSRLRNEAGQLGAHTELIALTQALGPEIEFHIQSALSAGAGTTGYRSQVARNHC